jgi:hypothetical protein
MSHKSVSVNFIAYLSLMSLTTPQVANQLIKDYANALCILLSLHHANKYQLSLSTKSCPRMKREMVEKVRYIN